MKPILYEKTEEAFTSNGLGRLSDAISCVTTEERNGIFELEMTYPVTGIHYADIQEERYISAAHDDTKARQPFQIYKIDRPMNGIVTVYARHRSYQLSRITAMPFTATSVAEALQAFKENAVGSCPFTFWTDKATTGKYTLKVPSTIRSMLGGVEGSILDVYGGGEYEWDNDTVKLHQSRGTDSGVSIRYGKNLTDLRKTSNIGDVWTGIVPYWMKDDTMVTLPEKALYSSARGSYSRDRVIPLDLSSEFEEAPTEAQLRTRAQAYINANAKTDIPTSIDISFTQLWQTEEYKDVAPLQRLKLCDTLTVYHSGLGINASCKITRTEYNVLLERYEKMTVGDIRTNLADAIQGAANAAKIAEKSVKTEMTTAIQKAVNHATDLIRGGLGGYVVMSADADGKPREILIMDTEDIDTAVNVLRINKNGIGFSSSGYEGPYKSAWTLDGQFVADFITTGTLDATLIKAGVLDATLIKAGILSVKKGAKEVLHVDVDTGEVKIVADSFELSSGDTIASIAADAADDAVDAITQADVFNKLTQNGTVQGIVLNNGELYINASYINSGTLSATYIKGGTLKLGGANNTNGTLEVYDASGTLVGRWNNAGVDIKAGVIRISGKFDSSSSVEQTVQLANGYIKFEDSDNPYKYAVIRSEPGGALHMSPAVGSYATLNNLFTGYLYGASWWSLPSSDYGLADDNNGTYFHGRFVNNGHLIVGGSYALYTKRIRDGTNVISMAAGSGITINVSSSSGPLSVLGDFTVTGTKSRIAETDDYGKRSLFCYETAAPIFGDIGEGVLDEEGECCVAIDDIFSETARTDFEYHVFMQKEGAGDCWIEEKARTYFMVKGTPGLRFSWELKARQAGYESHRLEQETPYIMQEDNLEALYANELENIIREQEALYETA